MRWICILALVVMGCGDEAPAPPPVPGGDGGGPLNITGLIPPPTNPGPSGGVSGAGGASGASGAGGAGGASGACDNQDDLDSLSLVSSGRQVAGNCNLTLCSGAANGNDGFRYQSCVSGCVELAIPGLSPECAGCYGAAERCGLDNGCYQRCTLNPCSSTCVACLTDASCLDELAECTGIPVDDCEG